MTLSIIDIHLAAHLLQHGIEPRFKKEPNGRVLFEYEPDERFFALQDEFNRDTGLQRFVSCLKRVRGQMLDARDNKTNGYGRNGNGHYASSR